jgi:glutaredoxin
MPETTPKITTSTGKRPDGWSWGVGIVVFIIILVILFGCWGMCTDSGKSAFSNIKNKLNIGTGGGQLKDLDIVMFMSPTCPWCKKMIAVLDNSGQINNITIVDINKPEGIAMSKQFGADKQPVPSFISRKLKTGTVGFRDSVAKLVDALKLPQAAPGDNLDTKSSQEPNGENGGNGGNGQIDVNLTQNLQIVLFAREGCPWCTKAKETCSESGVIDVIQVVDITTPEGQQMAGQMLPPGTSGVPAWVSMVTKKHVVGYKPIDQIIQALQ